MKSSGFEPDQLLVSLVTKISRLSMQLVEKELGALNLTMQEFRIMGLLLGEEGMPQVELARKLAVRPPTLTVAINRLVAKGYVKRVPSPHDRRVNLLSLPDDFDLAPSIALLQQAEKTLVKGLSSTEVMQLANGLGKVVVNLEIALQ